MAASKKNKRVPKFLLVNADYWQALFIDGKCVEQHHEIDLIDYLKDNGVDIEERDAYEHPGLEDEGQFPEDLDKIKFDK